jgi:hypothetical protein
MTQLMTRVRATAPRSLTPLDHDRLQRRGRRRRQRKLAGGTLGAVVVAFAVVAGGGALPAGAPDLGGGGPTAGQAAGWPAGDVDGIVWRLQPAAEAEATSDGERPEPGCDLWLAYEFPSGSAGGQSICQPSGWTQQVDRVSVAGPDGERLELSVLLSGNRRERLWVQLSNGERRVPQLVDLRGLPDAPAVSVAVVEREPGVEVEAFGQP